MVIPVRNRRVLVEGVLRCVARALEQCAFNVTVVDNGSADDTAAVVRRHFDAMRGIAGQAELKLIEEPRQGACIARNAGLRTVTTPFVMFFDSDDEFDADLPERISQQICDSPDVDMICWNVAYTDGASLPPTARCMSRGNHLMHGSLATQRYAVRTALVNDIGAWNETLPVWNDLELGMRLYLRRPVLVMLGGNPPVRILRHDESITGKRFSDRPGERELSLDAIEDVCREWKREDMIPLIDAKRLILAEVYRREGSGEAADALRKRVFGVRRPLVQRLALRAVAGVQRLIGRGGSATALLLL